MVRQGSSFGRLLMFDRGIIDQIAMNGRGLVTSMWPIARTFVSMRINPAYCLLLSCFLSGRISAQEITLDPVTVSTSMLEKRTSETGRNLTVIRGEDIQSLPANSLDELLRYLPGLEIQARGAMGAQSDISLRGGTFQQVLVVVDGLRVNDPTTGHFSSYIPVSPSEISRIEILKGASSSIYGSEAVGGVISVITKTFEGNLRQDGAMVEGSAAAGAYGLLNGKIGGHLKSGKLTVAGGVMSNNASGQELRGMNGFFHNHTASLSARYQVTDHLYVAYRAAFDQRDFAAQNFYTALASDTATEKVSGWWHQLEVGRKKGTSAFTFRGGYKKATDDYLYNSVSIPNQNISGLWQGLGTWQKEFSGHTDLIAGVHYQQRQIRSNDRGNHTLQQVAPFLAASHRIGDLTLHPSLRLDWRERIGSELVPQLNVSYKLDSWQLRASAGKTIRDADFTERYNNFNKPVVTGGSVGNPSLKAERSLSYEFGFDWFYGINWKVSATFFQRSQKDMIDYVPTPYDLMPRKDNLVPSGSYALAENIASVKTKGAELDVQYDYRLSDYHRISGAAGITLLDSGQPGAVPSFYLSSHAKVLVNAYASYRFRRLNVSVNGLYKKRTPREASDLVTKVEKSYFLLNAQAAFDLIPKKLTLYLQADNLTNTVYSDLLGAVMPRRWVMGGVKFRL